MKGPQRFTQLPLFMGGQELKASLNASVDRDYLGFRDEHGKLARETLPEMWDRKLAQSKEPASTGFHGAGVHDSLSENGWKGMPLTMVHNDANGTTEVRDGHHRVAASADVDATKRNVWVPLEHFDGLATKRNLAKERAEMEAQIERRKKG